MTYHKDFQLLDKRSQRSWHAIRNAFEALVLSKHYDEIKTSEIISNSGVARSTFYEHFNNKNAVLAQSLAPPLLTFAMCIHDHHPVESIQALLQHFWEKRSFCRLILTGTPRKSVAAMLVELIEHEIAITLAKNNHELLISNKHAANQIAESQLALVNIWLLGRAKSSDRNVALAMKRTSIGILNALMA